MLRSPLGGVLLAAAFVVLAPSASIAATPKAPTPAVCKPTTIRMEYHSSLGAKLGEYNAVFARMEKVPTWGPFARKCLWVVEGSPASEAFVVFISYIPVGTPGVPPSGNCDGSRRDNYPFYNSRKRQLGVSGGERQSFQNAVGGNEKVLKSVLAAAEAQGAGLPCPGKNPGPGEKPKPPTKPPGEDGKAGGLFIDYELPERFGLDANQDDLVDYVNTRQQADPGGWRVELTVSGLPCDELTPTWRVDGNRVDSTRIGRCRYAVRFPREGAFELRVSDGNRFGTKDVVVQDWLIVGIGDSVASGEGNPEVRATRRPNGRGGVETVPARWQSTRCHRSAHSFQARVAKKIEARDERTSVTFVHLACSGAGIRDGLLGPYEGIEGGAGKTRLQSQLSALRKVVGDREVDAVLVNVGANDLEFGEILKFCLRFPNCPELTYKKSLSLASWMRANLPGLTEDYVRLADRLGDVVEPERVFITEYPDELHNAKGICESIIGVPVALTITGSEATWLYDEFLVKLDALIRTVGPTLKWRVVGGGLTSFREHGYCARDQRWVVTATDSLDRQANLEGTMHPNESGHGKLSTHLEGPLRKSLYPGGKPRAPRRG